MVLRRLNISSIILLSDLARESKNSCLETVKLSFHGSEVVGTILGDTAFGACFCV